MNKTTQIALEVPEGESCIECVNRVQGSVYGFENYCRIFDMALQMKKGSWSKCQKCIDAEIIIEKDQEDGSGFW